MTRADGRDDDELRPVTFTRHWLDHAAGSVLVEFGGTRVLCVYGADEKDSLCPSLDGSLALVGRIPGGHVLDNSTGAAAGALVLGALRGAEAPRTGQ